MQAFVTMSITKIIGSIDLFAYRQTGRKTMETEITVQQIINTISEWHDHEGINHERNKILAIFCAFADLHKNNPNPGFPISDINAMRIALEAAFQLGRATGRNIDGFEHA